MAIKDINEKNEKGPIEAKELDDMAQKDIQSAYEQAQQVALDMERVKQTEIDLEKLAIEQHENDMSLQKIIAAETEELLHQTQIVHDKAALEIARQVGFDGRVDPTMVDHDRIDQDLKYLDEIDTSIPGAPAAVQGQSNDGLAAMEEFAEAVIEGVEEFIDGPVIGE